MLLGLPVICLYCSSGTDSGCALLMTHFLSRFILVWALGSEKKETFLTQFLQVRFFCWNAINSGGFPLGWSILCMSAARNFDWGEDGKFCDVFWWRISITQLWWRHWNDVITDFDCIIIRMKNHNLVKARNFKSPILKVNDAGRG